MIAEKMPSCVVYLAYPVVFRSCSPPSLQGSKLGASFPVRDIARMGQVQRLTLRCTLARTINATER